MMPNTLDYSHNKMRQHLSLMFETNCLRPFPSKITIEIRSMIVENDWDCLFIDRSKELSCKKKKIYPSESVPNNNVNRFSPVQHFVVKRPLCEKNEKKTDKSC